MTCTLIVSVDTEEEGLWGNDYHPYGNSVENLRAIPCFQSLCEKFEIKPTYLIDAPVVEDEKSVSMLKSIQENGRAEIGAHVHPWCNPPIVEKITPRNSYMCNLPKQLQHDKIAWLTDRIEERIGRRPTSFRAGRYGMGVDGISILRKLQYKVDSSVIPFTNYSSQMGPDFSQAPHQPYYIGDASITQLADCHTLQDRVLEVPVSVGYNHPNFQQSDRRYRWLSTYWPSRLRLCGIASRLGVVRRIKFSPEQASAREMRELVDAYMAQSAHVMVLMFHSSSLMPGLSPYVSTDGELALFYRRLEDVFDFCLNKKGMKSKTLSGFADTFTRQQVVPVEEKGRMAKLSNHD